MKPKANVFLSYRRIGGADLAHWIKAELISRDIDVFLDVDVKSQLMTNDWCRCLDENVKSSDAVIVVLSENSLDRCLTDKEDYVHREIAAALINHKNIVPIMAQNFSFPENLPEDMDHLRKINALSVNYNYKEDFLRELLRRINPDMTELPVHEPMLKPIVSAVSGDEYVGRYFFHVSMDNKMVAMINKYNNELHIVRSEDGAVIVNVSNLGSSWKNHVFMWDMMNKYGYMIKPDIPAEFSILDISNNQWVIKTGLFKNQASFSFKTRVRHELNVVCMHKDDTVSVITSDSGKQHDVIFLKPNGTTVTAAIDHLNLTNYMGTIYIDEYKFELYRNTENCLAALYYENGNDYFISPDKLEEWLLKAGKFENSGDVILDDRMHYIMKAENGISYAVIIRTIKTGEEKGRIICTNNESCRLFVENKLAVYNRNKGSLKIINAIESKENQLFTSEFFCSKSEFYHQNPIDMFFEREGEIFIFIAVDQHCDTNEALPFRIVTVYRNGKIRGVSEEFPLPPDLNYIDIRTNGENSCLALMYGQNQQNIGSHTALYRIKI